MKSASPFTGPVPSAHALRSNPIVTAFAQVRYPEVMEVGSEEFARGLHQRIRKEFPMFDRATENVVNVGPGGVEQRAVTRWVMTDPARAWTFVLGQGDLVLQAGRAYVSKTDFAARLLPLLDLVGETCSPGYVSRIGVRFINSLSVSGPEALEAMVAPGMGGPRGRLGGEFHSSCHMRGATDEGFLVANWGSHGPGETHDANLLPPNPSPSLFIDIDSFREFQPLLPFVPSDVAVRVKALAGRANAIFRAIVSDALVEELDREPHAEPRRAGLH
jgi:uncharacterized protein (TIGR04255 family)